MVRAYREFGMGNHQKAPIKPGEGLLEMLLNAWIQRYVTEALLAVFQSLYLSPGGGEDFITG